MKKAISILLALFTLLSAFASFAAAEKPEEKEDWEIYDNYLHYKNTDLKKQSGFIIESIPTWISEDFLAENEITASLFPEISDKIKEIRHSQYDDENEYIFRFDGSEDGVYPEYTEADIDEYISMIKYLRSLDFVKCARAEQAVIIFCDDPEPWEIYDNYFYYNDPEDKKEWGFLIDGIWLDFSEEITEDRVTPSLFPEISDKIEKIEYFGGNLGDQYRYFLKLNDSFGSSDEQKDSPVYTKEQIDEFINIMRYLDGLDFVTSATPNECIKQYCDPVEPVETEPTTEEPEPTEQNEKPTDNKQTGDISVGVTVLLLSSLIAGGLTVAVKGFKKRED